MNPLPLAVSDPPSASAVGRYVTLEGARMRYLQAGSGPALVLVHGLMGYSFSWRYALPAWAPHATVYAIDQLGAGDSDRPANLECSLQASAQRLLRFMDVIGIESCDFLGTSHGGGVVMLAAAMATERVRRLILVAPINPWSARGKLLSVFLSSPPVAPLFLSVMPHFHLLHDFYFRRLFGDTRRIRPGTLEGYARPLARPGSFEYSIGVLQTWNRDLRELESMLPAIANVPALLIWGSLDAAVFPSSARQLQKHFTHNRLLIMEGVGHLPYEEAPQEFNRAVEEFLCQRP